MQSPYGEHQDVVREIQFVKGVGPKLAPFFAKLGITRVIDLVFHLPRRYEDRRHLPPIRSLRPGVQSTVRGRIVHVETKAFRGRMARVSATLNDGTGQVLLTWFNQPWMAKKLKEATGEVLAFGMVKEGHYAYEIAAPEFEVVEPGEESESFGTIVPIYPGTEGLPQKSLRKAARAAIDLAHEDITDPMPPSIRREYHLPDLGASLLEMHRPTDERHVELARRRLVFDELFATQLLVQLRRVKTQQEPGIAFPIRDLATKGRTAGLFVQESLAEGETLWDEVRRLVPFELTGAQQRVIGDIWRDMERPVPMNRLVQGDVGSGKTMVAAAAMLAAVRCGYQAALMAPTEILAEQHAMNLRRLFDPVGIQVVFLAGKLNAKQSKRSREAIANGEAHIAVGTHALIQEGVDFQNLGLAVIDEQHRFGVKQRVSLRQKGERMPDVLVMTATPIPRTLAMTIYGDLDVSVIDELPPGRKPIKTHWKRPDQRPEVYEAVRKLIQQGRQAYFVCPAIEESEKLQTLAANELHGRLSREVYPDYRVGLLHGQLKPAEKEEVMDKFRRHELDILVATVVIEVGVDVPNASVMVVEDANRFGLSQLHQIRGRVGRGEHQSFCILIADAGSESSTERMEVMVETQDGFKISEADLRLRGPGSLVGTEQSGMVNFRLADLAEDMVTLELAKKAAVAVAEADPDLKRPEHHGLALLIADKRSDDAWISIS